EKFEQGDTIKLSNLRESVKNKETIELQIVKENGDQISVPTKHSMSDRQIRVLLKGGIINDFKEKLN
ncbi:hypothetical protein, partial [Mesonia mobilis]